MEIFDSPSLVWIQTPGHFKEYYNFSSKSRETTWVLSQEFKITFDRTKSVVFSCFKWQD